MNPPAFNYTPQAFPTGSNWGPRSHSQLIDDGVSKRITMHLIAMHRPTIALAEASESELLNALAVRLKDAPACAEWRRQRREAADVERRLQLAKDEQQRRQDEKEPTFRQDEAGALVVYLAGQSEAAAKRLTQARYAADAEINQAVRAVVEEHTPALQDESSIIAEICTKTADLLDRLVAVRQRTLCPGPHAEQFKDKVRGMARRLAAQDE